LNNNKAQSRENTCYSEKGSNSGSELRLNFNRVFENKFNSFFLSLKEFEIIYQYEKSFDAAVRLIQKLINEKFLTKDELNEDKLSMLKDEEVYFKLLCHFLKSS
jgi:hypothetical protein